MINPNIIDILYAYVVNYDFETRRLIPFDSPGKEKRFCGLGTITRPREQYQKVMDVRDS